MVLSPVRDARSLNAGKMCSYLLLMVLQLSCCQGASINQALRDIGKAKYIFPKQVSGEANQTVVCGPAFEDEAQKLKSCRIPKLSRTSSPELQFPSSLRQ